MIEKYVRNHPSESFDSNEIPRTRLTVHEGIRGAFDIQKREASVQGVESIDPRHAGIEPAISQINELSKSSLDYTVCTGILARGYSTRGKALSFITHIVPTSNPKTIEFYNARLRARLTEFTLQTDPRDLELGFFAGEKGAEIDALDPLPERIASRNEWYRNMREMTYAAIRETAAREPRLLFGPHKPGEHSDIFIDTAGGKLYIERY